MRHTHAHATNTTYAMISRRGELVVGLDGHVRTGLGGGMELSSDVEPSTPTAAARVPAAPAEPCAPAEGRGPANRGIGWRGRNPVTDPVAGARVAAECGTAGTGGGLGRPVGTGGLLDALGLCWVAANAMRSCSAVRTSWRYCRRMLGTFVYRMSATRNTHTQTQAHTHTSKSHGEAPPCRQHPPAQDTHCCRRDQAGGTGRR